MEQVIQLLKSGKIGVMPTDTIYGLVGSALNPQVVEEIYKLRKRSLAKPMIILIASLNDLNQFNIKLSEHQKKLLEKLWPNPVSVILPCSSKSFEYLHRGKNSLAFRMPKNKMLLKILKRVGPMVAPSANFEGEKHAENIKEAKNYFKDKISFYLDDGIIKSLPSTLISLKDNKIKLLRPGSFKEFKK